LSVIGTSSSFGSTFDLCCQGTRAVPQKSNRSKAPSVPVLVGLEAISADAVAKAAVAEAGVLGLRSGSVDGYDAIMAVAE
jgi:hypothetical protein